MRRRVQEIRRSILEPAHGFWIFLLVWTILIGASMAWNARQEKKGTYDGALLQARAVHDKDILYRRWNTKHGGVYVHVTEETQPSPYLSKMLERDIVTPSGRRLTLVNHAYMTRQVLDLAPKDAGVHGHLTGLKPLRPENAPDSWEAAALRAIAHGEREVSSLEKEKNKEHLRLLKPLTAEKDCLDCHGKQGFHEGGVLGGISVSIPMEPLRAVERRHLTILAIAHALIWLAGLGGIALWTQLLGRSEQKRKVAEEGLKKYSENLKTQVEERTAELRAANERLQEKSLFLQTLMDTISNPIFYRDAQGRFLGCNRKYEEVFGLQRQEIVGKTPAEVFPAEMAEEIQKNDRSLFAQPGTQVSETHALFHDGLDHDINVYRASFCNEDGNVAGLVGVFVDITEQKRAEKQIRASLREKEILLKEIHHRVKNNMQIVSSLMRLQSRHIQNEEAQQCLQESQNRIRTMALLHEKLYQSKDLGQVSFRQYIKDLATEIYRAYGPDRGRILLDIGGEDVRLRLKTAIPCGLIIHELLSNSLKHAFPGKTGGKISITLQSDRDRITLAVMDNGTGLPPGLDFRKSESLGLQLVMTLVEQLEGEIECHREKGTKFQITFRGGQQDKAGYID